MTAQTALLQSKEENKELTIDIIDRKTEKVILAPPTNQNGIDTGIVPKATVLSQHSNYKFIRSQAIN